MSITVEGFGKNKDGKEIKLYTITNSNGASIQVSDIGAVWVSAKFPDKEGKLSDVILGFITGEEYELDYQLSGRQVDIILAGGLLDYTRENS